MARAPYIKSLPNPLRIAVIAEDPLARSGLVSLLGAEPDFVVVGQAGAPDDVLAGLGSAQVMVWDVGARTPLALDAGLLSRTPTLALVREEETALALLRAGALGILARRVEGVRLFAALRAVATGLLVFEPTFLGSLLSTRAASRDALLLTPREGEVLSLMAEGLSNKLIADRLSISEHTVKFHVNAILTKLDAETRTEAVVSAARRGLLML